MSTPAFTLSGLHIRLAVARFGWFNLSACLLLLIGAAGWIGVVPHLQKQLASEHVLLDRTRHMLESNDVSVLPVKRPTAEVRLANFYDALGEKRYAEQQIRTLFAIAAKVGIRLDQGEYKLNYDKNGQFYTYQARLPVKGPYRAIRQFGEQTLLAIPFASLDEMRFKRDAIASGTLEAQLRFTIYLTGLPGNSVSPITATARADNQ